MSDAADKTLAPTPRRRQRAREAGQVAQSAELGSAVLLLGGLGLVVLAGGGLLNFLLGFLQTSLGGQAWQTALNADSTSGTLVDWGRELVASLGGVLVPLLAAAALLVVAVQLLQTGFLFMPRRILPDLGRVNPVSGLGRIYSGRSFARLGFGLAKVLVVAAVGGYGLWSRREAMIELAARDVPHLAEQAWSLCLQSCLEMGGALLVLATLDYLYQRSRLERDLQMTPQELREEMREMQGDPQIAARRRALVRERSQGSARASADSPTGGRRAVATTPAQIGAVDSIR